MRKQDEGGFDRRDFLSLLVRSALALLGLGALSVVPYLHPKKSETDREGFEFAVAIEEDALPRRGVRNVEFSFKGRKLRAYVARSGGELFALSPVCTHLGCLVRWNPFDNRFDCPCHGGKYDIRGNVIEGPPPRPLTRLPYRIENGIFYIGVKA
jgi:cytochrome b6-f complex iron-sulfur subunit